MLLREVGEDLVEVVGVVVAPVGRRQHPREQHLDVALPQGGDDLLEVGARHLRVDAAQRIVGAEFEDHDIGLVGKRPGEPGDAAGGGVTGDAGIDDPRRNPLLCQKHLQKIDAGERGRITEDLFNFRQRFAMSEQYAFDFTEGCHGNAIEHVVGIIE